MTAAPYDLSSPPEAFFCPDLGALTTLEVTGKDRQTWLNGLVTCNLAPLGPGQGTYGLATTKVGKILSDLLIFVAPDRLLLGVQPPRREALLASFENYLIMEDAEVRDAGTPHRWLLVHGPAAAKVTAEVAAEVPGSGAFAVALSELGDAALVVPEASLERALEALGRRAQAVSRQDWEWLRIEHALPRFGADFDEKTYPQEAALERRAVSFNKGCYLGQEVICRLEMRGHVHRRLALLHITADPPVEPQAPVKDATGEPAGLVTSAAWSPRHNLVVALAMVKYAHSTPGTALRVGDASAVVVDPSGELA